MPVIARQRGVVGDGAARFPPPAPALSAILGPVNAVDLSLITGGFTIAAVAVTFGGNYLRDRARDRRAGQLARDSAIADLLTTSVALVLAVNAIRAAYQHRTNGRLRLLIAAALLQDLPNLDAWRDLIDRDVIRTSLRTATGLARDQETDSRTIALDYAGMVLPQMGRFFAAVTAVAMGPSKEIAGAARQLGIAGGALLEAAGAKKRNHARAQDRFDRELGKFRAAADRRRQFRAVKPSSLAG